jgi:GNAT superfamily N-acetyltransferase
MVSASEAPQREIRNLATADELLPAWPVVRQLRPQLEARAFVEQALRQQREGWRATGLFVDGEVRAFAGWRVVEYLVHGRHAYVDDLVTDADARGVGHGKALLDWLKAEARALGCGSLHLDSGTQRKDAHAFYLREGLRIDGFHFGIALV